MANLKVIDSDSAVKEIKATGAGSAGDPLILERAISTVPADPFGVNADAAVVTDAAGTFSGKLRGLVKWAFERMPAALGQGTMAQSLRVVLASDQSAVPASQSGTWTMQPGNTQNTTPWLVSPIANTVDVTVTRPADTIAYAANDELSDSTTAPTVNTITSAARASGGTVRLISARCIGSANQSTKPQLLVYVFDTTTTPDNDNAAFTPTDTELNTCVAILPFNVWYPGDDTSGAGGNAISPYLGPPLSIKTSGSANLFFRIKVLNAYTPVSAEAFKFRFDFIQD